ncbi:MAG TPA: glycoside hydrolase family 3 N-terminal domain-containing protein [Membranihabitans sp.]|nr:glycoside hydrolase family 3 N-terminal domain-containing protein [Membranihabitans sp.]
MRISKRNSDRSIDLLGAIVVLFMLVGVGNSANAQNTIIRSLEDQWVDSVYRSMSLEERIGQLFMVRAHSNLGPDHIKSVTRQIEEYKVGGLCFFQGTPARQIELVNQYQGLADVPLLISMDAEWGPAMRFREDAVSFPRQLTLGAINNNELIYKLGVEVARELKLIGVNFNFAPVTDINNNFRNPVINDRSFGEDKYNVTAKAYMYMKGMQDQGILACAKHFPGHGDTHVDSHVALPVIKHDLKRLWDIELYPFNALAKTNLAGIMVAHLNIPALDNREKIPSSLSYNTITKVLKDSIGFKGLIITDALEMKAVSDNWPDGIVEFKAFEAGNDILLLPNNLPLAIQKLKQAVNNKVIPEERLAESVKKILHYKYSIGLDKRPPILSPLNINQKLKTDSAILLKEELIRSAATLVRDDPNHIPLNGGKNIVSLALGASSGNSFQKEISRFTNARIYQSADPQATGQILKSFGEDKANNLYVISLHGMAKLASKNFGLSKIEIEQIVRFARENQVIVVVFGSPYALTYFDEIKTIAVGYDDDAFTQTNMAQAIFGKVEFKGRLPVTASPISAFNQGITTTSVQVLQYGLPESVGIDGKILHHQIDSIVKLAIFQEAMPGCEILVAKNNVIVLQKSYGYHTYENKQPVDEYDLYDLASITKVVAGTAAVMKLYEEGKVDLDEPISQYLPLAIGTNKANLTLRNIMAHRAGLKPWIPFYTATLTDDKTKLPSAKYYRNKYSEEFPHQVTSDLFLRADYPDTIFKLILDSPLRPKTDYKYSDLGFYLVAKMVENLTGKQIGEYVREKVYEPLGMTHTAFQPYKYFPLEKIVPTEEDGYFRHEKIQGYVHDMGSAMWDGISGHAGLFSNSRDMAVFFQMLINEGTYGGKEIFHPTTIREFTTRHPHETRRGIGFDMKSLNVPDDKCNIAYLASPETFGHYGFTGTAAWADPANELVYVFLSNRTYPNYPNRPNLLSLHNYRSKIQNAIYVSMGIGQETPDISQ